MPNGQKTFLIPKPLKLKEDIKILAIVPSAFCYGLQHITLDFFGKVQKSVYSHFLLSHWNDGSFSKELEKRNIAYSYSWLGMFSRKLDWYNIKMSMHCLVKLPKLYFDFILLQRRLRPDLLYFANHHELILLYPVLLLTKTPIVCHMHDPSPAIPFQKFTFRWYGSVVDHFIAISESVKKRLIELGADSKKIKVIYNGVTIPEVTTGQRGNKFEHQFNWPSDAFIVGITGQMTATKGHEDLIIAFGRLINQIPNLRLVIGGKKIEPFYSELLSLITNLEASDKIAFSGWQEFIADFFEQIDLFVLASRHDEGYGLVVAEAMANQKPVIATESGGVVELVEDKLTGYIVPKKNVQELVEKINQIAKNKNLSEKMGMEGHLRVKRLFDFQQKVVEFEQFLIQTINNQRS